MDFNNEKILVIFFIKYPYKIYFLRAHRLAPSCCFFEEDLSIASLLPGTAGRYLVTDKRKKIVYIYISYKVFKVNPYLKYFGRCLLQSLYKNK